MNFWYDLIGMLPFEWAEFMFMKKALLAILLITPVFGLLGSMIVNNKMSFFSDALGHSALTGMGIGVVLGISNPSVAMVIFCIAFAVGIVIMKHKSKSSMDTTIGVFSSTAVALGVVLLSGGGFNKNSGIIAGDILSITDIEIIMLAVLLAVVLIVWKIIYKKLFLISLSPSLAISRGINVLLTDIIFTCLIALVVAFSIRWVGLLIINSLFVLPAAGARTAAKNMKQYVGLCVLISIFCGLCGLFTAYYMNVSVGATIALYCSAVYVILNVKK